MKYYPVEVAPNTYRMYDKETHKEFNVVRAIEDAYANGNLKTSTKK